MPTKPSGPTKAAATTPKRQTKPSQPAKPAQTAPTNNQSDAQPTDKQSQLATILIGLLIIASGLLIYNYFQNSKSPATVKTTDEQANHTSTTTTPTATPLLKENTTATSTPTPTPTSKPQSSSSTGQNPTKQGQYTVVAGDSLWSIAQKVYGSGIQWSQIDQANHLPKDQLGRPVVEIGQVLTVPNSAAQSTSTTPGNSSSPSGQAVGGPKYLAETPQTAIQTYTVKHGDTLWSIAQSVYGSGQKWTLIYSDPHNRLGQLPNGVPLIHAGNELYLPDDPSGP